MTDAAPLGSHNPQQDDGDQEAIILITVAPARVVPGSIKDINILASKASRISPGRFQHGFADNIRENMLRGGRR